MSPLKGTLGPTSLPRNERFPIRRAFHISEYGRVQSKSNRLQGDYIRAPKSQKQESTPQDLEIRARRLELRFIHQSLQLQLVYSIIHLLKSFSLLLTSNPHKILTNTYILPAYASFCGTHKDPTQKSPNNNHDWMSMGVGSESGGQLLQMARWRLYGLRYVIPLKLL